MTIDEQRIFVCEKLFGWKPNQGQWYCAHCRECKAPTEFNTCSHCGERLHQDLPPLTLDWLHECAKALPRNKMTDYHNHLYDNCGGMSNSIEATAEQRLAALVETLKQSPPVSRAKQS